MAIIIEIVSMFSSIFILLTESKMGGLSLRLLIRIVISLTTVSIPSDAEIVIT